MSRNDWVRTALHCLHTIFDTITCVEELFIPIYDLFVTHIYICITVYMDIIYIYICHIYYVSDINYYYTHDIGKNRSCVNSTIVDYIYLS